VAVGGPVEAVFETPPPRWFREEWERRSHGPGARYLEPGESFSGSNMVIARGTILECGGFDESVGMRGNTIGTGEETQLFHAIRLADGAAGLYYDPSLRVEHPVAPYKVSARYQLKRVFADAQSRERARRLTRRESLRSLPRCAASLVRGVTSALLALPRYRDLRVWAVERLGDAARSLGRMHAALGLRGGMSQSAYDRPQERPEPLQGESPEQT